MLAADVLVIDDDPAILQLFLLAAKKFGINCVTATNGQDGINKFSATNFKLIITDLEMPKINGIQFISEIKSKPQFSKFPIVLISANFAEHDSELGFEDSVHLFPKPITLKLIEDIFKDFGIISKQGPSTDKINTLVDSIFSNATEKAKLLIELAAKVRPVETKEEKEFSKYHVYLIKLLSKTIFLTISVDNTFQNEITKILLKKENATEQEKDILINKVNETFMKKTIEIFHTAETQIQMCKAATFSSKDNAAILTNIHSDKERSTTFTSAKGCIKISMVYF